MGRPDRDLAAWWPRLLAVARTLLARGRPAGRSASPRAGDGLPELPGGRPPELSGSAPLTPGELAELGRAVQQLSLGLTRDRGLVGQRYLDEPRLLAAYLLFYWPVSYAQTRSLLGELTPPGPALDLGSGPAPASFALLDAGAPRVLAADRSAAALDLASRLAAASGGPQQRHFSTQRWLSNAAPPSGRFGIVVAQHLLNELWGGPDGLAPRLALCRQLLGQLAAGGTLLLVEPALRDTSRQLLQLRDGLVAEGFAVRAPCLFRGPCPALQRASDWCHAERDWDPPAGLLALARAAGLHKERLKMSYLAVAAPGEGWAALPPGRILRIVSEPLQGKGRARFMGCGPEGRLGLALQDKHVTAANAAFSRMERGEVVRFDGAEPKGDGLSLGSGSRVETLALPGQRFPSEP